MLTIGITGGSGSGKTYLVKEIEKNLQPTEVTSLSVDSYYKDNVEHLPLEERVKINFDHPQAIDYELLINHIRLLKEGKEIQRPNYCYVNCRRKDFTKIVSPSKALLVEGILLFNNSRLLELFDIKVFIDIAPDERLARIISRDTIERGRDTEQTLEKYRDTVRPMFYEFIDLTKKFSDLIVHEGSDFHKVSNILCSLVDNHTCKFIENIKKGTYL